LVILRQKKPPGNDLHLVQRSVMFADHHRSIAALAPTKDDPALGEDPQRNNNFTYANDPHGKQAPLGCHIAADEPA
jgi:hypothetical protein